MSFMMIDTSWSQIPAAPTLPQLEGPWSIARGLEPPLGKAYAFVALASAAVAAYHGARRNGGSIFWGTTWFALGAIFPVITPVIAIAQGVGDCKNNCSTGRTVHLSGSRRRSRR